MPRIRLDRLIAAAANAPLTASVAVKHLSAGPTAACSALVRALPAAVRGAAARPAAALDPVLGALVLHALGRRDDAADLLRDDWSERRRSRRVEAAAAVHDVRLARELAGADESRLSRRSAALLLHAEGSYRAALRALGSRRSLLREVIAGDLGVLTSADNLPHSNSTRPGTAAAGRTTSATHRAHTALLRIAHIVTTAMPEAHTGYAVRTQGIARAQCDRGASPLVVSRLGFPADQGALAARPRADVDGVAYLRLLPRRPLPLRADRRLDAAADLVRDALVEHRAEIVHAHSKHDNAQVAVRAARSLGLPVVYEARGMLEETWRSRGGSPNSDRYVLSRRAETSCMEAADAVVTLAETMRAEITSRGVAPERVHVIPNAVDSAFLAEPGDRAEARRALGLPVDGLIVGMTGTLNDYEGVDTLIRALALVGADDVTLLIVGGGPALTSWRALADALGVAAVFTGRVPRSEVRRHIEAMDLFCVPRCSTPVTDLVPPLKPLEAMATGVPVLASDVAPLRELIAEAGSGWNAPAGDAQAWAETITEILADRRGLSAAGASAREWVMRERTWERQAERLEEVYAAARAGAQAVSVPGSRA